MALAPTLSEAYKWSGLLKNHFTTMENGLIEA